MTHPPPINAIPTRYAGCHFRSRLEARWAVFFDALNLTWEYEPQGYVLPDGDCYLPDFWLPSLRTWFEVKGPRPSLSDESRVSALGALTNCRALLAYGDIPRTGQDAVEYRHEERDIILEHEPGDDDELGGWDIGYAWCSCPVCGRVGVEYDGRGARVCPAGTHLELFYTAHHTKLELYDDKSYTFDSSKIEMAYRRARSARFGR